MSRLSTVAFIFVLSLALFACGSYEEGEFDQAEQAEGEASSDPDALAGWRGDGPNSNPDGLLARDLLSGEFSDASPVSEREPDQFAGPASGMEEEADPNASNVFMPQVKDEADGEPSNERQPDPFAGPASGMEEADPNASSVFVPQVKDEDESDYIPGIEPSSEEPRRELLCVNVHSQSYAECMEVHSSLVPNYGGVDPSFGMNE